MPEGDVVARVARNLTQQLGGQEITQAQLRWPTLGGVYLRGIVVLETTAYGKNLFTAFDNQHILHTHLKMDGMWRFQAPHLPLPQNHRLRAIIGTAAVTALGWQLGAMHLIQPHEMHLILGQLGPDLMSDEPAFAQAAQRLAAHPDRAIGACLLDQTIAAGIGTIYMAETLWLYRMSPWRPAKDVPEPQQLFMTASALMKRAAHGPHRTATGDPRPGFTTKVYGREHRPCRRCGSYIKRASVGDPPYDRPAYYCPRCQSA